jgi:uncharacterized protein
MAGAMDPTLVANFVPLANSAALYVVALAGTGFIIGALVGMTGVGTGSLTTPVLVAGFGVHPIVAVGTDLLFACLTKSTAAWRHHRLGHVDWHILKWLALGSAPAAALVLGLLAWINPDTQWLAKVLRLLLGGALLVSAMAIVTRPWLLQTYPAFTAWPDGEPSGDRHADPLRTTSLLAVGVVLGGLVALTSIGAGAIGVVALTLLFPLLPAKRIVGTDIVHAIPLTLISGLGHMALGNIDWRVLAALLVGSIPGIALGSRVTGRLPEWLLRSLLATVLVIAAAALWRK